MNGAPVDRLWDASTGRFDAARLRRAMVLREWVPDVFATEAGCGRTSVYKALAGHGVRDRTAIKILTALGRHPARLSDTD